MPDSLESKVAIVTGSTSGIGEATARALDSAGASVVVNSARSVGAGERVAADLQSAIYVQADIAKEPDARRLIDETIRHYGRLDVLVNNAGTTVKIPHGDLEAVTPEIWHRILDVNVVGTWSVTTAAVAHLRASANASIVNITSVAGVRPTGSSVPYAVSKAALNHMTALLAKVLGPEIRVNAVAPGLVDTPWTAEWEVERAAVQSRAPLARTATADDVAEAVMALLTSSYQTGTVVLVDGGLSLA